MTIQSETTPFFKALIYGHFGVGKTQFAGTASDCEAMRDVLFVRIEDGTMTVRHKDHIELSRVVKKVADVETIFWRLAQGKADNPIRTVVLDSGTDLVQLCREEVVAKNCAKNPNKDKDQISLRDHGDVNFILTRLFRMFRDLPMHVIITALVTERFNTDDPDEKMKRGPVQCLPAFPPMLGSRVMAYVDHVWSIHRRENGSRFMLTQPKGPWTAKTRNDLFAVAIGTVIENPTLPTIMQLLTEKTSKQND